MSTLALPTRAWCAMTLATSRANPYRYRRETGGWLLARAEEPTAIVAATGIGEHGEMYEDGVWISRDEFDGAARKQGFVLAGEWHLHPDGTTTDPSPEDKDIWRRERLTTQADSYASVILARGSDGTWTTGSATGYRTTPTGCEPVKLSPSFDRRLLEAVNQQASYVRNGPLLRWPASWKPGELSSAVGMLELDDDLYEKVRLRQLNERLQRLGINRTLSPLPTPS